MQAVRDMVKFLALESPTYTVQSNDTLESISLKTGVGVQTLRRINKLFDSRDICTGQTIKLYAPPDQESHLQANLTTSSSQEGAMTSEESLEDQRTPRSVFTGGLKSNVDNSEKVVSSSSVSSDNHIFQ